jgi:Uma2 family endonuclease
MVTVTEAKTVKRRAIRPREADQCVVLRGIGWDGYRRMLTLRGDRARPRMIYLDGDLLLMSPGHLHERDKERFGMFVVQVAIGLRIAFRTAGSTTYRQRKNRGGIEPDQSYYFANAPRVRNKKSINLKVDPPPDLSIEVVYSHSAKAAIEVSRRFRIPEIWVCTERGLTFLVLGDDGLYVESSTSLAFPYLSPSEVLAWVRRPEGEEYSDLEWSDDLASWIRETVLPRLPKATN